MKIINETTFDENSKTYKIKLTQEVYDVNQTFLEIPFTKDLDDVIFSIIDSCLKIRSHAKHIKNDKLL